LFDEVLDQGVLQTEDDVVAEKVVAAAEDVRVLRSGLGR